MACDVSQCNQPLASMEKLPRPQFQAVGEQELEVKT